MIHSILKDKFGYTTFRPLQQEAIESIMGGKDVLLVLPTGGGKSICFQIPALAKPGLSLVISPLIALMNDQVLALRENGIEAYSLHSNIDYDEKVRISNAIDSGDAKLIYMSPEGLLNDKMLSYISSKNISLIAVDEAHCVSMWGNDFRPDYVKLSALKSHFPEVPIMAVTATADKVTQQDIVTTLQMVNPPQYVGSFERENITITALPGLKRFQQILAFLGDRSGESGIIYCTSRKSTQQLADKLNAKGIDAACYHAGLDRQVREQVHQDFIYDRIKIVCATIAFGMGIDKSNIRFVIHYNLSKNIESYYQEIGRAGRDGSEAEALLFFSYADISQLKRFIDESAAVTTYKQVQHAKLDRMWEFSNTAHCRTNIILSYFNEYKSEGCGHCDNCLNPPETFDGTKYTQMALSGVYRAKERINFNILIDILRGSSKQEIMMNDYHQLKTYGVGRELPFPDWRSYLTQMIHQGYLSIDYSDSGKLKLTPLSHEVLFESKQVNLVKFVWQDKEKKPSKTTVSVSRKDVDQDLFVELRSLRTRLANEQSVPAYIIFPNKTLEELAAHKPQDKVAFSKISGVGKLKLEKYADDFIQKIKEYGSR